MLKIAWRLFLTFLCGYLLIKWFPVIHPVKFTDFMIRLIINPLEFFAASIAFVFGLVMSGQLLQEMIQHVIGVLRKQNSMSHSTIMALAGLAFVYFFLFQSGWEQTTVLFSFSFLYGMISLNS
jgi:hypothetical protein